MTDSQKAEYTKSYLNQLSGIKQRIQYIEERRQALEERSRSIPSKSFDNNSSGHRSGNGASKIEEFQIKITECIEQLVRQNLALLDLERRIESQIQMIPDEKEQLCLQWHYIEGKNLEEVSIMLFITYRHTTRIHGRALIRFFDMFLDDRAEVIDNPL